MKQVGSNVTFHTSAPSRWKNDAKKQWRAFGTNNRIAYSNIQPCKVLLNVVWVLCPVSVKTLTLCICCKRIPGMHFSICRSAPLFDIRHGHPIFTKELRGSAMIERQGPTVLPNLLQGKAKCCKDGGRIDELLVWQNTNFDGNAMNLSEGGSGQFILSRSRIDASTISTMVLIVWLLQNNFQQRLQTYSNLLSLPTTPTYHQSKCFHHCYRREHVCLVKFLSFRGKRCHLKKTISNLPLANIAIFSDVVKRINYCDLFPKTNERVPNLPTLPWGP